MLTRIHFIFFIISVAFLSLLLSLTYGSTSVSFAQLLSDTTILLQIRLPRTITAFVSGGLLAIAGTLMQLLLKNPLADPYALGISGGAAVFTLLMMLLGLGEWGIFGGAWLGSFLSIGLIFLLAYKHRWQTHTLLLSGIAIACGYSAIISFILLISPNITLHSMLFWLTGDLNDTRFPILGLSILIISIIICLLLGPGLNLFARGEREARALGLASRKYKIVLYLLSSLCTAAAVTLSGCIGFIGLIIPHITRLLVGSDHRVLLPIAMILGGTLLTLADTLARSLFAPLQLPVGMMMALIGVPIFIWLLSK